MGIAGGPNAGPGHPLAGPGPCAADAEAAGSDWQVGPLAGRPGHRARIHPLHRSARESVAVPLPGKFRGLGRLGVPGGKLSRPYVAKPPVDDAQVAQVLCAWAHPHTVFQRGERRRVVVLVHQQDPQVVRRQVVSWADQHRGLEKRDRLGLGQHDLGDGPLGHCGVQLAQRAGPSIRRPRDQRPGKVAPGQS